MKEKNFKKKGEQYKKKYSNELGNQLKDFLTDCQGKTDEEIKKLYEQYDGIWRRFANRMNMQHRNAEGMIVMGFTDSFEDAVRKGYGDLKGMKNIPADDLAHYKRVFKLFRDRNIVQRIIDWITR